MQQGDQMHGRVGSRPRRAIIVAVLMVLATISAPAWAQEARGISRPCPPDEIPTRDFADVRQNVHEDAIDCLAFYGITRGTTDTLYSPELAVRRDQMASFLARFLEVFAVELPASPVHRFSDVSPSSVHALAINQLAEVGIVAGVSAEEFAPAAAVRRDQMTAFLHRAYIEIAGEELAPSQTDYFADDDGNPHETHINRLAEEAVVAGTSNGAFSPHAAVRRDQMASFLMRLADLLLEVRAPFTSLHFAQLFWTNVVEDSQETPSFGQGEPGVSGSVSFQLDSSAGRICYTLRLTTQSHITGGQLHHAPMGHNGPAVMPLVTPTTTGTVSECVEGQDPALILAIEDDPSGYYVNVSSRAHPDGAARGQLATSFQFAQLSWVAQVNDHGPTPEFGQGERPATGLATMQLDPGAQQHCVYIQTDATGPFTALDLHEGPMESNGPAVLGLRPPAPGTSTLSHCASASRELLTAIVNAPARYYLNLRSVGHPAGAVRGQLFSALFGVPLRGTGGGEPRASGEAWLMANFDTGQLCQLTEVDATPPFFSARILERRESQAVVNLLAPDDSGRASGCTVEAVATLNELAVAPDRYEIRIASTSYPDGALRGVLPGGTTATSTE